MKICAYVQEQFSKTTYKNECLDARQFVGLKVIIDALERDGRVVEWAGKATVHKYDIVLVSLTADCDWWSFISERTSWQKGNYKVIVGGAGVMHITPFLPFCDYFVFGRGEDIIVKLIKAMDKDEEFVCENVATSNSFDVNKCYYIAQAAKPYPHAINIDGKSMWNESMIGCNHKCLFCSYTWHRKCNYTEAFMWDSGKYNMTEKECAMLDYSSGSYIVNWNKLRTTAIDGFSERLRFSVGKKITKELFIKFMRDMIESEAKPHQVKIFNICGLPTETVADWHEIIDVFKTTEKLKTSNGKQWSVVLHSTPFRAMPATPLACKPMAYYNYRGKIAKELGKGLKGNLIYQGKTLWAVESMGTESLPTVILSAIAHRGTEKDTENIIKLCNTPKFWKAGGAVKQATLEKYFDVKTLFGGFKPDELPNRYLRSYANVEKMW